MKFRKRILIIIYVKFLPPDDEMKNVIGESEKESVIDIHYFVSNNSVIILMYYVKQCLISSVFLKPKKLAENWNI